MRHSPDTIRSLLGCLGAFAALFLWWVGSLPAAAQPRLDVDAPLRFDHLSVEDGLSHTGVNAVYQDSQGFLWFGTTEGLNRYDGYTVTVYAPDPDDPNSLGDAYITMVYEDRAGNLWVGTRNGGLHRFDPRTETFTRYRHDPQNPDSISDNGIAFNRGVYEDPDGMLWIGTWSGGFNRLNPRTGVFTRYRHNPDNPNSVSHHTVHAIVPAAPGVAGSKLWIGTLAGLDLFDPVSGDVQHYGPDADKPGNVSHNGVTALAVEPPQSPRAGLLWVGMLNGTVAAFDPDAQTWTPLTVSDNLIEKILRNDDGTLWITTFGSGLLYIDPERGTVREYRQQERDPESLSSDMLRALYRDRAGTLWISSHNAGLNILDPLRQQFRVYRHHDPNAGGAFDVSAIARDQAGMVWIGTYGDGLSRFDPATGVFTPYRHDSTDAASLSHNTIGAIYEDRQGTLWIGTYGGGLNAFNRETGTFTRYLHRDDDPRSLSENNVSAILEDAQGALWVGTVYGGLNRLDRRTGEFTALRYDPNQPDSLVSNSIRSLYEDRAGNLWICTNSGLDRFERDLGRFRHYRHQDDDPASLSSNMVSRILETRNGDLWVTGGLGLNRFDPAAGTFTHYFERDGLPHNRVNSILEDRQGHLWLGTADGLSKFTPATETFRNYDARDGLQGNMFYYQAAALGTRGELYVGGPGGLTVFHPDALVENPHAPPVVLTDFRLFNESVPIGGDSPLTQHIRFTPEVTLSREQSNFELEFAALNYTVPSKNRYAYVLDGFDPDWTQVDSATRVARYTNLDPGAYTFRVKASNNDGVWNETGTSVRIVVLPAWWETWWFRSLAFAALLGVAIGAYRWRVMALRQQQRELEALVDERTADLTRTVADYQTAEQALRESHERFVAVMNSMEALMYVADLDTYEVLFVNRYTRDMFGEVEGRLCWQVLQAGQTGPCPFCTNAHLVKDGEPTGVYAWDFQNTMTGRWYHIQDQAIRWTDGRLVRLEIATDITDLKDTQAALYEAKEAAEAARRAAEEARQAAELANTAKSTFLAKMSHELRTPLNTILGFSQLLTHRQYFTDEDEESLDIIMRSGDHLLTLINEILEISRIEAGQVALTLAPAHVRSLVDDVVTMLRIRASAKGLTLTTEWGADLPEYLNLDEMKLRQVLINLLSNAIKFTEQGAVTLRVSSAEDHVTNEEGSAAGESVPRASGFTLHFAVSDTGPGIAADDLPAVFETFTQAAGQHADEGSGLGLAISRQLARLMGGDVTVSSVPGVGATFTCSIRTARPAPRELETLSTAGPGRVVALEPGQPRYRMLIVDDSADNRRLLNRLLAPLRCDLCDAVNGEEALHAWKTWQPRLIWMDIRLPDVTGYEVTRRIRDLETAHNVPAAERAIILAVTASAFEEARTEALRHGCDDFLRKPFQPHAVFELLRRYLGFRYRYADPAEQRHAAPEERRARETRAMARPLPQELVEHLTLAVTTTDFRAIERLIEQIRPLDGRLAEQLQALVEDFDYANILDVLRTSQENAL